VTNSCPRPLGAVPTHSVCRDSGTREWPPSGRARFPCCTASLTSIAQMGGIGGREYGALSAVGLPTVAPFARSKRSLARVRDILRAKGNITTRLYEGDRSHV